MGKKENQAESDIQACLRIKHNGKALSCLKKVVKESTKGEGPRLVLLVSPNCEPCEEEAALHKKDIAAGIIEVVEFGSDEGLEIAEKNDLDITPALILLGKDNKLIEPA